MLTESQIRNALVRLTNERVLTKGSGARGWIPTGQSPEHRPKSSQAPGRSSVAVQQDVLEFIKARGYLPGDQLPSDTALAGELGSSRTTVMRAMIVLTARGLVATQEFGADRGRRVGGAGVPTDAENFLVTEALTKIRAALEAGQLGDLPFGPDSVWPTRGEMARLLQMNRRALDAALVLAGQAGYGPPYRSEPVLTSADIVFDPRPNRYGVAQWMEQELQKALSTVLLGTRIPNVDVLSKHFKVALGTAQRAVSALVAKGFLTSPSVDHRGGLFTVRGSQTSPRPFPDGRRPHFPGVKNPENLATTEQSVLLSNMDGLPPGSGEPFHIALLIPPKIAPGQERAHRHTKPGAFFTTIVLESEPVPSNQTAEPSLANSEVLDSLRALRPSIQEHDKFIANNQIPIDTSRRTLDELVGAAIEAVERNDNETAGELLRTVQTLANQETFAVNLLAASAAFSSHVSALTTGRQCESYRSIGLELAQRSQQSNPIPPQAISTLYETRATARQEYQADLTDSIIRLEVGAGLEDPIPQVMKVQLIPPYAIHTPLIMLTEESTLDIIPAVLTVGVTREDLIQQILDTVDSLSSIVEIHHNATLSPAHRQRFQSIPSTFSLHQEAPQDFSTPDSLTKAVSWVQQIRDRTRRDSVLVHGLERTADKLAEVQQQLEETLMLTLPLLEPLLHIGPLHCVPYWRNFTIRLTRELSIGNRSIALAWH